MSSLICIIAAIKEETSLIKVRMKINDRISFGHSKGFLGTWLGHQVLVVQSGLGKRRARNLLGQIIESYSPTLVISFGFAGGLNPDLKLGDVLIAKKVIDISFKSENQDHVVNSQQNLVSNKVVIANNMLGNFFFKVHIGPLITSDIAVCLPRQKMNLGQNYYALGVDMETSALLEVANQNSVPLISVRGISDPVDQELVNFSPCFDENGNVSKIRAGWYVLTNPSLISKTISLKYQISLVVKNMTEFLEKLIENL